MGVPRAFSGVTGPADEAPRRLEVSRLDRFREIDEDLLEVRGVRPQIPQILRVDFEFAPMEGRLPYDVLLEATDPKLVQLEIDLYWTTKGGQDPLKYFARWPGRIPLVHVKDSGGPPDNKMMDVGAGTIDWKKIFAREDQAGIRHAFVEHDQPADAFASIKASCEYLKRLEF